MFKELERQYGVEVRFSATNKEFNGIFRHDNLRNALNEICQPMGLSFKISNDKVVTISE